MEQEKSTTDLLDMGPHLVRADSGKRFLNYIIDIIAFYIFLFILGIILGLLSPELLNDWANSEDDGFNLADRLLTLAIYAIFMGSVEALSRGRSLGKLITGPRAVNEDGSPISSAKAFARGFSRAVPFCAFSALGSPCNPWQDSWTNTIVVDLKQSDLK